MSLQLSQVECSQLPALAPVLPQAWSPQTVQQPQALAVRLPLTSLPRCWP